MKLPTLNVDVAVNTKTMQKGIAEANKQLQTVGRQGLGMAGGSFGRIGGLSSMAGAAGFGGLSTGLIGIGAIAAAISAPFKAAALIVDTFGDSIKRGEEAMKSFSEGKGLGGLDLGTASRLAAGAEAERANQMATGGLWDTFMGAMANEQGQFGGLPGLVKDWGQSTAEASKWLTALSGSLLGGYDIVDAMDRADMATTKSAAGAQAYMTPEQIDAADRQAEKYRKAQREQNT